MPALNCKENMSTFEIKRNMRVLTKDGRKGLVVDFDGNVAEVLFPEGEEWINFSDLYPAVPRPSDMLLEHFSTPLEDDGGSPNGSSGNNLASWDNAVEFGLHQQANFLNHVKRFDPLAGLTNARIEPKPHQVSIVRSVIQKRQARMILADEVGLGKTIEAGLVLKELRSRGLVERALVVCPASLQMQWQIELQTKFNESFEIIDGIYARVLGRGGENPFAKKDFVICSLDFAQKSVRAEQIVEAGWDFVVFDEAHRVRRWLQSPKKFRTTKAYELAESLEPHTPDFLMLTATPMQLHPFELYSLIQIVEPGIFETYGAYEKRRRQLPLLNDLVRSLVSWRVNSDENTQVISELEAFIPSEKISNHDLDDPERREEVIDLLIDQHPLAGVLVRNRKAEIGGFMGRQAVQYGIQMSEKEKRLYEDIETYLKETYTWARQDTARKATGFLVITHFKMLASSPAALYASFDRRIKKLQEKLQGAETAKNLKIDEDLLRDQGEDAIEFKELESALSSYDIERIETDILELEDLNGRLADIDDSKLDEFVKILESIRSNEPDTKVVVFTAFKSTQKYLADNLGRENFTYSVFHGGLSLQEKERAVRDFRESTQVLISTEAGAEGRNLQYASVLINYDLPWNPMKVEQRIGRLDRIGQKKTVQILNLFRFETVEERVHRVLNDRINLFEESVGSLDSILGNVEKEIEDLFICGDENEVANFEKSIEEKVSDAREAERVMSDLALDRSSFRRDETNSLLGEEPMATYSELRSFVSRALEHFGGRLNNHDDGGEVISLSPGLATKLELPSAQQHGVFDPQIALEREDLDFFALGNRWVDNVVKYAGDESRSTATVHSIPDGPASPKLEIVYEFRTAGRNPKGMLIVHRVGSDLSIEESCLKKIPVIGEAIKIDCPDWLDAAIKASENRMKEQFESFTQEVRIAHDFLRSENLERNERIAEYRRQRFIDRIDDHLAWINEVEESGTEGQLKILPARKGRLAADQDRLERVDAESLGEREKILNEAPEPTSRMWSAALVVSK